MLTLLLTVSSTVFIPLAQAQDTLRVETWNVGLAHGFVDYADQRLDPVLQALGEDPADLICLEEVWEPEDRAAVIQAAAASHPYALSTQVEQTKAAHSPACRIRDLFGEGRFVSCMTGSCGGLDGDALTDCIVDQCGPILEDLKTDKPDCANALMAQVGKSAPKALWTVVRPFRKAGIYAYGGSDGLVLLSDQPFLDSGELDFSDIATLNRRRALYADVAVGDQTARLYCTHLSANLDETAPYPGPFDSWAEENRAQVDRLLEHAAAAGGPTALMGDFNCSTAGGGIMGEAEASCQTIKAAGYADPSQGDPQRCTWCADNHLHGEDTDALVLDHIFIQGLSSGEGAVSRDEPITIQAPEGGAVTTNLSDHYGYALTLAPDPLAPLVAAGACGGAQPVGQLARYELGEGRALLEVTCEIYAYQLLAEYWLEDADGLRGAGDDGEPLQLMGIPTFDGESAQLDVLAKARGAGDCGVWIRYQLGGSGLSLVETRARECDEPVEGEEIPPPSEWPLSDEAPEQPAE